MIYICYGVTKSASTFLYQLTEEILLRSGQIVCRVQQPVRGKLENYYDHITLPFLERVEAAAQGRAVVLKTHGPLQPGISALIATGRIKASASIRDPREMALSMADNGRRARSLGLLPFSEIVEPTDALPSIDMQLRYFEEWAAVSAVEVFTYNEVCFATDVTITRLCRQLGVDVSKDKVLRPFRSGLLIGQINRATPRRYATMSSALQEIFLQRYADFYGKTDLQEGLVDRTTLVASGNRSVLVHRLGNIFRFMRRLFLTRNLGIIRADEHG